MAPRNIILVTSDEMRGDCAGFAGNPDIKTANLDRLAAQSLVLPNHFAVHGKCVPSRIALATGRYCHTDGIRAINEANHLPKEYPDVLSTLKAQGYEAAVFGHNHVWENFWGTNQPHSSLVDYHSYTEGVFKHLLDRTHEVPASGSVTPLSLPSGYNYYGRMTKPRSGFVDENRVDQAVHYLTKVRDRDRPFFLQVNFGWPHPPYHCPEPWFSAYDRKTLKAFPHRLPSGAPLPHRAMRELRTGNEANEEALREIQATYYGMISAMDGNLGRLLTAIDDENLWRDTVFCFTADHGDFAGQYGLIEKWDTAMNDCILHVPCLLRAPGVPSGTTFAGLSEHIDLTPTFLDLLGVAPVPGWIHHGRSLLPAIATGAGKETVFADGGHEAAMRARFNTEIWRTDPHTGERAMTSAGKQLTYQTYPDSMARTKMVRTKRWKLVVRETGGDELYDLEADPWELENLFPTGKHQDVVIDLQRRLLDWCLRTDPDRPELQKVGA